jgi:CRISPR-associated endonuclease Cas2
MSKKKEKKIKYGELTKAIILHLIKSLEAGYEAGMRHKRTGILLNYLIDTGGLFLKALLTPGEKRKRAYHALKNLERQKIVELVRNGDDVTVFLKNKNHPKIVKYSIKSILDLKKKKRRWNKKWILVFFDVPEEQKNKRDYLRKFLKEIGFYSYQKSVYVFPYECKKEIGLIKKIIESGKYLKYVVAEKIEDERKIKQYFDLD